MNIFISHSWNDKTVAQTIADSLKSVADIWLDLQQLYTGQHIQSTIDQALARMDLMVVIWSKSALKSNGVAAELAAARKHGTNVLPCLLDKTRVDLSPYLNGILGLDFSDRKMGLFRLQMAVLREQSSSMGAADVAALNDLKSYEGALDYVNDYRNKRGLSGEDSSFWALKLLESGNQSFESLSSWQQNVGDLLQVIQSAMARIEKAGNDVAALEAIRADLQTSSRKDTKEMRQLTDFIDGKVRSMGPAQTRAPERDVFNTVIAAIAQKIKTANRQPLNAVRTRFEHILPRAAAAPMLESLVYYLESCPANLEEFVAGVNASCSASLHTVAAELFRYLVEPNDLLPDAQNGILGFLDDAWLIHNTIYRCIEASLLDQRNFSTDWNRIGIGNQVATQMFPPHVSSALDDLLNRYIAAIADEMQQYASAQNRAGACAWSGQTQSYSGSESQTIDDCFYTIGDKAYFTF